MKLAPLATALMLALAGCGGNDAVLKPVPLTDIRSQVGVDSDWKVGSEGARSDSAERFRPYLDESFAYLAGHDGSVSAVALDNGKQAWETGLDVPLLRGVSGDASRVYVTTLDGEVIALGKAEGEVLWRQSFSSEVLAAPAASPSMLVVRTNDGYIYGLSPDDGSEVWRQQFQVPVLTVQGYATPLIVPGGVLTGLDDGTVVALSLTDGRLIWRTQVARPDGRSEIDRLVDVDGPLSIDQQYIYAASYQGQLVRIEPQQGRISWSTPVSSTTGVSTNADKAFVSTSESHVLAVDKQSGAVLWETAALEGRHLTRPVPVEGAVIVGDLEGYIHWLDEDNGELIGRYRLDNSPVMAAPVVRDDAIYLLSRDGVLRKISAKALD
ncbi:outer membrane protein assembly factor BamB [Granulosicoccaceae sp. 1_MG-2023]|nr:outer membrane protein assembly factor BamB [Granulosicoccaceae sp. 1_MG-2023]